MTMLTLAGILALVLLPGCSRPPAFETYTDPGGDYTLEVPEEWPRDGNADRRPKPLSVVEFIGKMDPQVETPMAYYVIEYRATQENFDRYSFALPRARSSFRLLAH